MERGRPTRMRARGPRSMSRSLARKQACSLTYELNSKIDPCIQYEIVRGFSKNITVPAVDWTYAGKFQISKISALPLKLTPGLDSFIHGELKLNLPKIAGGKVRASIDEDYNELFPSAKPE
jgi:hypothetical protein